MEHEITKNLKNPKSFEYQFLKRLIEREVTNDTLSAIIADVLDGQSPNFGPVKYDDILINLEHYEPEQIELFVKIILKPSQLYAITPTNFKEWLQNGQPLNQADYTKLVREKTEDKQFVFSKIPNFNYAIRNRLSFVYQSQKKKLAAEVHLAQVLRIRCQIVVLDDTVRTFVAKNLNIANQLLMPLNSRVEITTTEVEHDNKLKKLIVQESLEKLYVVKNKKQAVEEGFKLTKPDCEAVSKFVVNNKQYKASSWIIRSMANDLNRHSEIGIEHDTSNWDNERLYASVKRYCEQNVDIVKEVMIADQEFSYEYIQGSTFINRIDQTVNYFVIITA